MDTSEHPKRTWQAIALELSVESSSFRVNELAKELHKVMEADERQRRGKSVQPTNRNKSNPGTVQF